MKTVCVFLSVFCLAAMLFAKYIPTPSMAVGFDIRRDVREWEQKFIEGDAKGFICEFVPAGDAIEAWNELVAQQIIFTKQALPEYVERWKAGLLGADPDIRLKEQENKDGSITVHYHSDKANEAGIRRFMKASDGIYMLTYQVRPKSKNEPVYQLWSDIIEKATLSPNPHR
ncbi:MAG: hypothetical protein WCH86_00015 [Kiritimatiellales bacterium]